MNNMEDIKMTGVRDNQKDDRDMHLDFDMFDFIYSLVSTVNAWEASLSPLDHPLEKFDKPHINKRFKYDAEGNKIKITDETSIEHPRVASDAADAIVLYSDDVDHFNDIIEVCKLYNFNFEGPTRHTALSYYWEWSFKVFVPMTSGKYPMMIEDYFDTLGIPLEKVMHQRWVTQYRSKIARLQKESEKMLNEKKFDRIYDNAVKHCWQRGDISVEEHFNKLIETLESEGLTYKKTTLRNKFMGVFKDDIYEEKAVVTPLFA